MSLNARTKLFVTRITRGGNGGDISGKLGEILTALRIKPKYSDSSRNGEVIKLTLYDEEQVEVLLMNSERLSMKGLKLELSAVAKNERTAVVSGEAADLLCRRQTTWITEDLERGGLKPREISLADNRSIVRIGFNTRADTQKFLRDWTYIGDIALTQGTKEKGIYIPMNNCGECGKFNPDHNERECRGRKICVRCGATGHKHWDCPLPLREETMTPRDRDRRYCGHCVSFTDHTTFQNNKCPGKKRYKKDKENEVRRARRQLEQEKEEEERRMKRIIELAQEGGTQWTSAGSEVEIPTVNMTLLMMAIFEDAVDEGVFEERLAASYLENGLKPVKYTLREGFSRKFMKLITRHDQVDMRTPGIGMDRSRARDTETGNGVDEGIGMDLGRQTRLRREGEDEPGQINKRSRQDRTEEDRRGTNHDRGQELGGGTTIEEARRDGGDGVGTPGGLGDWAPGPIGWWGEGGGIGQLT